MSKLPSSFSNYAQLVALDKNLTDHGALAESQLSEEFPKWLKKFNAVLKERGIQQSWKDMSGDFTFATKTDFLVCLYLYSSQKTAAHALRDRSRLLKAEIGHLVSAYIKVGKRTQALLEHPRLACVILTSAETYLQVFQSLNLVTAARQKLEALRPLVSAAGSGKIHPQDASLYALAEIVQQSTGQYRLRELANFIQTGYAAHGDGGEILSEETLTKRLQRFRKRHSL